MPQNPPLKFIQRLKLPPLLSGVTGLYRVNSSLPRSDLAANSAIIFWSQIYNSKLLLAIHWVNKAIYNVSSTARRLLAARAMLGMARPAGRRAPFARNGLEARCRRQTLSDRLHHHILPLSPLSRSSRDGTPASRAPRTAEGAPHSLAGEREAGSRHRRQLPARLSHQEEAGSRATTEIAATRERAHERSRIPWRQRFRRSRRSPASSKSSGEGPTLPLRQRRERVVATMA